MKISTTNVPNESARDGASRVPEARAATLVFYARNTLFALIARVLALLASALSLLERFSSSSPIGYFAGPRTATQKNPSAAYTTKCLVQESGA